jgi:hypothetical protein
MANGFQQFNPVQAFQGARQNALTLQRGQQQIEAERQAAPVRNQLAQLQLQGARTGQEQQQTQFGQQQALQRTGVLNKTLTALSQLPTIEQRQAAVRTLDSQGLFGKFDIPVEKFSIENLQDQILDTGIATTQGFLNDPSKISVAQRERTGLIEAIRPALNEQGQFDISKADASSRAAAIALGLIPKAGTITGQERIAEDPKLTERVATSQGKIKAAVKLAEVQAKERGETITDLARSEAALPGLIEVVGKLKSLADNATFTLAGKGFNAVAKQFGFSTEGDTSRTSMVSIVDNQVLPLLKPIFGAAFTAIEGDRLRNAFLDPDSTPDSRKASLDAFLQQMERNIETKRGELGVGQESPETQRQGGQLMEDANGNRALVFPDGTIQEVQ